MRYIWLVLLVFGCAQEHEFPESYKEKQFEILLQEAAQFKKAYPKLVVNITDWRSVTLQEIFDLEDLSETPNQIFCSFLGDHDDLAAKYTNSASVTIELKNYDNQIHSSLVCDTETMFLLGESMGFIKREL